MWSILRIGMFYLCLYKAYQYVYQEHKCCVKLDIAVQAINQIIHLVMAAYFMTSFRREFPPS